MNSLKSTNLRQRTFKNTRFERESFPDILGFRKELHQTICFQSLSLRAVSPLHMHRTTADEKNTWKNFLV